MYKDVAHEYAVDVSQGKVIAGRFVRLACERYLADLDSQEEKGLTFSAETARAYLAFFEKAVKHTIGEWNDKPFIPLPWQQFILWNLYGWRWEDGTRRFNYAYISIARKNGKTTLMAACALAALYFDQEQAAEVYFAATKRDQARIAFDEASRMGKKYPLSRRLKVGRHDILVPSLNARATYLSSDKDTLDGLNVHFAGIDEYHAHNTDAVSNVLRSGMQARKNPLHLTITTAGFNTESPCYQLEKACKDILEGDKIDEGQFAIMYQLDEGDNWTDTSTWEKANPSIDVALSKKLLEAQLTQAINLGGSREVEFKTKHLNLWVSSSKTWIQREIWERNKREVDTSGLQCWAGLDLASVSDMTALVMAYPMEEGYFIRGAYFMPSDTIKQKLEREPNHIYRTFKELPNFFITDGNVTDYQSIRKFLSGVHHVDGKQQVDTSSVMHEEQLQKLAFDRYNSTQIAIDLVDDGVPLVPFGQGFVSMSAPTKMIELLARQGKLWHDGDPVLSWCLSNVDLKRDPAGNIKPDKQKSSGKIDAIVALAMAIGEHMKSGKPKELTFEVIAL